MTDSEVATLKAGDKIRAASGLIFTVTTDARPTQVLTHFEAWAVSPSGNTVVRVTALSPFERITFRRKGATK